MVSVMAATSKACTMLPVIILQLAFNCFHHSFRSLAQRRIVKMDIDVRSSGPPVP